MEKLLEQSRKNLLERARALTQFTDEELKRFIRIQCEIYHSNRQRTFEAFEQQMCRNSANIIYGYCSELLRRRTGKHSFEPTSCIYRFREVVTVVKLSDIVPHVVETEA